MHSAEHTEDLQGQWPRCHSEAYLHGYEVSPAILINSNTGTEGLERPGEYEEGWQGD